MYSKEEIEELFASNNEGIQSAITRFTVDEENETLIIENGTPL